MRSKVIPIQNRWARSCKSRQIARAGYERQAADLLLGPDEAWQPALLSIQFQLDGGSFDRCVGTRNWHRGVAARMPCESEDARGGAHSNCWTTPDSGANPRRFLL